MRQCCRVLLVLFLLLGFRAMGAEAPAQANPAEQKPVIVVFDFDSAYDGGRVGKFVASNLSAKLDRTGKCILVDRGDFDEAVRQAKFAAGYEDNPADIVKFAAEKLGATHVIWGKVEQAGEEGLKVSTRAASSEDLGRELILDASMTVKNQREVQLATNEAVRLFFNIEKPAPEIGPAEEKAWQTGPNLVKNPGFEDGKDHPDSWDPFGKDDQHDCVKWGDSPEGKGKCIQFDIPENIAATYGAAYYSDPISVKDGTVYRVSVRVRSDGPSVKVFLKHYRLFPAGPGEKEGQWRETRRAQLNCSGGRKGEWQTYTMDFHPHRGDKYDPEVTKVELYAYWPKGVVYFDDVVLKKLK